jgi:hypothetical protein
MIAILPVSLLADDTAAAMLHSSGGVLVNKNPAPTSTALFRDDLIETPPNVVARIEATGSAADLDPETVVQFEGDELVLDHGSLSVNTSRLLRVRVGCLTIEPVRSDLTHYEVRDVDGKVTVSALKNDVYINAHSRNPQEVKEPSRSRRTIVREGEQKTRDEKCEAAILNESGPAGTGALMSSPYLKWTAIGVIGLVACLGLCHDDDPVSPSKP